MDSTPKIPQNKILIILTEIGITSVSEYSFNAKPNLSISGVNKDKVFLLKTLNIGNNEWNICFI